MLCATEHGEPLSVMLRPGNAAANSITDHICVLDAAVAQLPEAAAARHREGDEPSAPRQVQMRVDAAGCSVHIADACRARDVVFFMTARSNGEVTTAINQNRFDAEAWKPALRGDGEPAERAQVAELTEFADLEHWPQRTRFIARREPLHPVPSAACSTPSCGATAGSTPTPTATPPNSTPTCEPTPASRTPSPTSKTRPQTHALSRLRRQRRLDTPPSRPPTHQPHPLLDIGAHHSVGHCRPTWEPK